MNIKKIITAGIMAMIAMSTLATPAITGVTAQQRYPWNGKADISYTVTGDIAAEAKQRAVFTSPREFAAHDRGEYDALECHFCGELTYAYDNFMYGGCQLCSEMAPWTMYVIFCTRTINRDGTFPNSLAMACRGHSAPGIEHVMTRQCLESFHAEGAA